MIRRKFAALVNVKTIITFVVAAVFAVLALRESIPADRSLLIITIVFGFYFGTQKQKQDDSNT